MIERLAGEVIGFRRWFMAPNSMLRSTGVTYTWTPGINEAVCLASPGFARYHAGSGSQVPDHFCGCGLYGVHDMGHLGYAGIDKGYFITGAISAWGKIEVHHGGFRAQYARPVMLAEPYGLIPPPSEHGLQQVTSERVREIGEIYKIPVVLMSELQRVITEFGSVIPHELRPALSFSSYAYAMGSPSVPITTTKRRTVPTPSPPTPAQDKADRFKQALEKKKEQHRKRELFFKQLRRFRRRKKHGNV